MADNSHKTIVIRLVGDSGDGVQLLGEQLTITAAQAGHEVRTLPDYPAEIRAPQGTVAGISGFQLAMADAAIYTAGESLDVLVCLNPAGLKTSLSMLKTGGLLLINQDAFTEKDYAKAGITADTLEAAKAQFDVVELPLSSQSLRAVEGLDIATTQARKTKNFYVLGLVLWMFHLPTEPSLAFIAQKFKKHPALQAANEKALRAGYYYAETVELSPKHFLVGKTSRKAGEYRQINGLEAVSLALATLAVELERRVFVSGYPITPASGVLHECAKLAEYGIELLQAEDEIAAISSCLGAAFGGHLALTCSSGPGMDLKAEALGLAVMAELPMVVLDVQRAGTSTGLPTKTGQSDLALALYGRHGEAPLPILAPRSPGECFSAIIEAFRIATRYMTPVIVLMDAYLANAAEPWQIPDIASLHLPKLEFNRSPEPFSRNGDLARSWNLPGTPGHIYQLGGLEKQGTMGKVSYDADNHAEMIATRAEKVAGIAKEYTPLQVEGAKDANTLVLAWGSTYGAVKAAVQKANAEGAALAFVCLEHIFPLPKDLGALLQRYKRVFVAELNSGHLHRLVRAQYLVDAKLISQCNGQPFKETVLLDALKEHAIC